jgi:LytS/YehU family sensor histidine kinase
VENAIWHGLLNKSADRHLTLSFRTRRSGMLEVVIEDNGVGRQRAAEMRSKDALKRKSYGMQITNNRIKALNQLHDSLATVNVEDLVDDEGLGQGTRVVLQMPYKETSIPQPLQKMRAL